ncbi:MAG TPA: hypothetical protein VHD87_15250 [Acidimicrobiales bacterium]|nr:hypothetical protein [Acidimicrobiales bacterium]
MPMYSKATCRHCAEPVMRLPHAPGPDGPVLRWVHARYPNDPRRWQNGGEVCAGGKTKVSV